MHFALEWGAFTLLAMLLWPALAGGQEVRVRDLTATEQSVPVRLMGYGLVVGLDGTGDRASGSQGSVHTVQSIANLLKRFDVEVPTAMMRTRNVAAVLVTAEVSPFLRAGGRFEVKVSSLGDARSLRGGVLWMTPLVADVGGEALASAQGPLVISDGGAARRSGYAVETTAALPDGGVVEGNLPRPAFASASRLLLKEPDLGTAVKIAEAINRAVGAGTATVEDPGSVALAGEGGDRVALLSRIGDLRVQPDRAARLVINGRDGTLVAGGGITVGPAVVSHGVITLSVGGGEAPAEGAPGNVQVAAGTSVQEIAAALHAVEAPPAEIAAIFQGLREVGAISAEVVVR